MKGQKTRIPIRQNGWLFAAPHAHRVVLLQRSNCVPLAQKRTSTSLLKQSQLAQIFALSAVRLLTRPPATPRAGRFSPSRQLCSASNRGRVGTACGERCDQRMFSRSFIAAASCASYAAMRSAIRLSLEAPDEPAACSTSSRRFSRIAAIRASRSFRVVGSDTVVGSSAVSRCSATIWMRCRIASPVNVPERLTVASS